MWHYVRVSLDRFQKPPLLLAYTVNSERFKGENICDFLGDLQCREILQFAE